MILNTNPHQQQLSCPFITRAGYLTNLKRNQKRFGLKTARKCRQEMPRKIALEVGVLFP